MNDLHEIEDRLRDATRAYADGVEPAPDAWDRITRRTRAASRRRRAVWIGGTASVVAAAALFAGALLLADDDPTRRVNPPVVVPGMTTPTTAWTGPLRDRSTVVHRMTVSADAREGGWMMWQDPIDASLGWADVKRVRVTPAGQAQWNIELKASPPRTAHLEPGVVFASGLVFDTTNDGVADYVVGIDNDAPKRDDFHVWVTNLATGRTEKRVKGPYGYPIEFRHPDEQQPNDPLDPPEVVFTFLGDSRPADLAPWFVRFYAWTSVTRDGKVIANDYAPDTGWITAASLGSEDPSGSAGDAPTSTTEPG